jgi:hypothetical protein
MSQVDDILYAPISSVAVNVDFQIRPCMEFNHTHNYDWKPISSRAHEWCKKHYPYLYKGADPDGWLINFHSSLDSLRVGITGSKSYMELNKLTDFVFEDITQ